MKFTIKTFLLAIAIAVALSAGLTLGLRAKGNQQTAQQQSQPSSHNAAAALMGNQQTAQQQSQPSNHNAAAALMDNQQTAQQSQPSSHNAAAALMVTYDDLKRVAAVSNLIIKGVVLPGSEVLVDIGARKPYPHAINPVKVISVFKGTPSADVISVGVMLISTEGGDWRLQPGGQVYLFMERVDHGKASYAVPYDYATQGPQGQYYVRNGLIEPKGPPDQATTKQFKGVKEEVFVEELRRAIGSQ